MQLMYYIGLDVHKRKISYCQGREWHASRGRIHWMKTLPQRWSAALEATMFTGWIYDQLKPHAAVLKVGGASADAARHRRREKEERPHRVPGVRTSLAHGTTKSIRN